MKSLEELRKLRKESLDRVDMRRSGNGTRIVVGMATCGISAGARSVMMALVEEAKKRNLQDVTITQTGCIGACRLEPMFEVYRQGEEKGYVCTHGCREIPKSHCRSCGKRKRRF